MEDFVRIIASRSVNAQTAWVSVSLIPTTYPPLGLMTNKIGGRPPQESPADFSRTKSCEINFAEMEVTVAGLNPVWRAISALPIGPCALIVFKTCERLIARIRSRLPVGCCI